MTVAEWYAQYQQEGRAWLPRVGRQERHWLVRFQGTVQRSEAYAHCFAESATLYLYTPDTPVSLTTRVPLAAATMDTWARRAQLDAHIGRDVADQE